MKLDFKNIHTYKATSNIDLYGRTTAFHGLAMDDRTNKAISLLEEHYSKCSKIKYKHDEFIIELDERQYNREAFDEFFVKNIKCENVIIEATTLSFAEILYLLSASLKNDTIIDIQILYIEPEEYQFKNTSITTYDDFALSDKFEPYPPLAGFTINAENKDIDLIAFLGFEKSRLGQIFTLDETTYKRFTPVIPLPGFRPGWENRTINNHLKFFKPKYFFTELKYVSANNPYQAFKILDSFSRVNNKFRIAPIGTKPNAIGCAVFLVNNEGNRDLLCGVLFDFPLKTENRSNGIGKIHIYNLCKS